MTRIRRLRHNSTGALSGRWTAGSALGVAGASLLFGIAVLALLAPFIAGHDPAGGGPPLARPSLAHPLGTDDLGGDIFAQFVYGARISLLMGLAAAFLATTLGVTVALLAGYLRGAVDAVLMRIVDLALTFPMFPLALVLVAFFGRGIVPLVVVIVAILWARPARILRAQVLKVSEFQHVVAARTEGLATWRILVRHVLPRITPMLAAEFVRAAGTAVLLESALAFLGLEDPSRLSWGTMLQIANARNALLTGAWTWWMVPPALALCATVMAFALIGFAFEERADPRLALGTRRQRDDVRRPAAPHSLRVAGAPPSETSPLVGALRDCTVIYGAGDRQVTAVADVSLELRRRRITGLVGASGSGKSTVALAMLGLVTRPARMTGEVELNGRLVGMSHGIPMRAVRRREIGYVPQGAMNALNPVYTVRRQVTETCALTMPPQAAARRAVELLELVGIDRERHGAYPHELSGGMRQRAVIAIALSNSPSLLIADEPTTGLDAVSQAGILRLLLELREAMGLSILLISHDLPLVMRAAEDLYVMHEGRIVEGGPTETVRTQPRHAYTRELLAAFAAAGMRAPAPAIRRRRAARETVLELQRVSRTYRQSAGLDRSGSVVHAVRDASLSIGSGEIVALIGGSGAGKSTLGRLAIGIERPDSGRVIFDGADTSRLGRSGRRSLRHRTHLVFQDPYQSLHPGMRVAEIVAEPLVAAGLDRGSRRLLSMSALEEVELVPVERYATRFPHELSGGQRQRVALARALVGHPRLVVADEPTSMLDASLRAGILELLLTLRDCHDIAFLLITHDVAVARATADRVAVLHRGEIVEVGPTAQVLSHPANAYTRLLLDSVDDLLVA